MTCTLQCQWCLHRGLEPNHTSKWTMNSYLSCDLPLMLSRPWFARRRAVAGCAGGDQGGRAQPPGRGGGARRRPGVTPGCVDLAPKCGKDTETPLAKSSDAQSACTAPYTMFLTVLRAMVDQHGTHISPQSPAKRHDLIRGQIWLACVLCCRVGSSRRWCTALYWRLARR